MERFGVTALPAGCLLLAMMLWASTFVVLKIVFQVYDPMVVIFGRMLVASLCALFFPFVFKNIRIRKNDIPVILLMVLCEPCLYFVFEAKALIYTSAAQAGMITAIMPLLVAVAAWFFLKEELALKNLFGLLLAIFGAVWLSLMSEPNIHASNPLLGNFLEFMAMVCAACYAICLKKLSDSYSPLFLTFIQSFGGALFFFPVLFFPGTELPTTLVPVPFILILYLGAGVSLGAFGLYNYALSRIPAGKASAFINLIPVFTLLMSSLILKERFTNGQYIASGLVFAGVFMSQIGARSDDVVDGPECVADKGSIAGG